MFINHQPSSEDIHAYARFEKDPAYKSLTSAMALYRPSLVLVRNRDPNVMLLNDYSALRRAGPGNVPAEE